MPWLTRADLTTSFQGTTLDANLFLDVPNPVVGTVSLNTNTHKLVFSGTGADLWNGRNGLPFAWTPAPSVGFGGVWQAETEVQYYDTSRFGRIVGLTTYPGPDGAGGAYAGQEFTFGLDHWDSPNGVWVQGLGDNRPGDSGNLVNALTADIVDLRMVVTNESPNSKTYVFYYKLPSDSMWTRLGSLHDYHANNRVALFFKGGEMNVSFNYFNVTTLFLGQEYLYTTNANNTLTITGYGGLGGNVTVPEQIGGLTVSEIGNQAFSGCSSLTCITLPDSITSIGDAAFINCSGLTNAAMPTGVTQLGSSAFYGCLNLTHVTIPTSVTAIGNSAFGYCSALGSVSIPDGVTSLGPWAFNNCISLTNVVIPVGLTTVSDYLFYGCSGLTSASFSSNVTVIGEGAFNNCTGLTDVTIPATVTSIGGWAFSGCTGLTNMVIPDSVSSFGDGVFNSCFSLASIRLSTNLTSIGYSSFASCYALTDVTIPRGVTSIGYGAFSSCSGLTNVLIGADVTAIGDYVFDSCIGLTRLVLSDNITSVGYGAFFNCSGLTSMTIPASVTSLSEETFGYCTSLARVYFKGNAPWIDWWAFDNAGHPPVLYYLPGTTGWEDAANNTGLTAVLWNPVIRRGGLGFGPTDGGFYFNVAGTVGIPIEVEASTNLTDGVWIPLLTTSLSDGSVDFTDADYGNFPVRFYRVSGP